jgi:hypothetical protein
MEDIFFAVTPILIAIGVFLAVWAMKKWLPWRVRFGLVVVIAIATLVGMAMTDAQRADWIAVSMLLSVLLAFEWFSRN